MTSKDFFDYLKRIPEKDAIAILDDMNIQANRMADVIARDLEKSIKEIKQTGRA